MRSEGRFESPMALPMEHRVEGRTSMEIQEEIIGRREISGGAGWMVRRGNVDGSQGQVGTEFE